MQLHLPEIVSMGIYNAQLHHKKKNVTENRKTTMFELEMPLENGGFSYIDRESEKITPDLLICAKPGQLRHTRLPFKCYYIHIIVTEGPLHDILLQLPNYIRPEAPTIFAKLFQQLQEAFDNCTPENQLLLHSLILRLVYLLNQCAPAATRQYRGKHNHHAAIEQTLLYIKDNLSTELTLGQLAEQANFSPVYFHNLFKASTGKTTHEYIEEQRIKKAMHLLITTDMTLTKICYECGFSSQSYFNYVFKRKTGSTPRAYAKQVVQSYHESDKKEVRK